ncbi:MAG: DUF1631 family protein [Gammaproteobacteria bacterium]|nr:DUF1631 family protein [Gammaproteobacteria bacterium]
MPKAEELPKKQPAEIHVEGIPRYAGEISAFLDQALLMIDTRVMQGKQTGDKLQIHAGSQADLVFRELFDEDGSPIIVPVTLESATGTNLSLTFRDAVSIATGNLLSTLRSESSPSEQTKRPLTGDILPELRKRSLRQLDKVLNDFLLALADHLFDMSSRPQSRDQQDELYESMNIIKRQREAMREAFAEQINYYFDDPVRREKDDKSASTDDDEFSELGLVDIQDFEDTLSLDRMIKIGVGKYAPLLECLTIRYAELTSMDPLQTRLPMHVAQVCRAFRTSLENRELPQEIGPEIYSFFSERVVRNLDALYTGLNAFLRDQGVCPTIEEQVKKHGSILQPKETGRPDDKRSESTPESEPETASKTGPKPEIARESAPVKQDDSLVEQAQRGGFDFSAEGVGAVPDTAAGATGSAAPSSAQFDTDSLYRSVMDALSFKQGSGLAGGYSPWGAYRTGNASAAGGAGAGGVGVGAGGVGVGAGGVGVGATAGAGAPASGGTAAGTADQPGDSGVPQNAANPAVLAAALSSLQHSSSARSELQKTSSLREYLARNHSQISALKGTDGIAPESLNQLDLVDSLFSSIRTDVDVMPDLQPSLGDLHIPLAKLALMEPEFFIDKQHSARGVVDKLAQLSSSANYPNKPLENRVTKIVESIVENYETDSEVFDDALQLLDKLVVQQERALERNVERVIKTQDGQQKLQKAHRAVDKLVHSRIRPPTAPRVMVDLIESGWRDLLILTHVKNGPGSKAWKDYVKTLDLLSLWLIEQQKGGVSEQVAVERALEAEPFVDMIHHQITTTLPTNVSHEPVLIELKEILAGRAEVELVQIDPIPRDATPAPAQIRKKIDSLPRLRRWVKRVEELSTGTWLSFKDKDGKNRRMQLTWISEDKDRYIFVNERGQKIADLGTVEFARQLSKGVKPPSHAEDLSLVDQSMYNTLEHVQKSLSFENNHDSLTRLTNKKAFMEQLDVTLTHAKAKHSQNGLLCIDIDQFSLVNEVYDEVTGDQVLSEFAKLLAQQHNDKVFSARLEGNKFAVLLKDRSMEQAVAHAENVRTDIEKSPITLDNDRVSFTVSIGIAPLLDHHESVEQVMSNAESALRNAKEEGRNKVVQFRDEHWQAEEYKSREAASIAKLEKTLETDSFVLRAQPIVRNRGDVKSARVYHYEVLLGLKNEKGELESPQDFIVNAERFGYMVDVDRWVINQVFTWISQQMDEQKQIPYLAINISGTSISDDNFMDYLLEQISEYGVGTNRLCFEITETGTISNMVKAGDFVRQLKNIGCRFAIDDFGTGLASHSYLRELPVDMLKIDGTFISKIHENDRDYAMVKSINDLAHFLGQETIAEFVENDAIIEKLREIGVDYLQGWGVGKPILFEDLTKTLEALEK